MKSMVWWRGFGAGFCATMMWWSWGMGDWRTFVGAAMGLVLFLWTDRKATD